MRPTIAFEVRDDVHQIPEFVNLLRERSHCRERSSSRRTPIDEACDGIGRGYRGRMLNHVRLVGQLDDFTLGREAREMSTPRGPGDGVVFAPYHYHGQLRRPVLGARAQHNRQFGEKPAHAGWVIDDD